MVDITELEVVEVDNSASEIKGMWGFKNNETHSL